MRTLRTTVVALLVFVLSGLGTSALAADLTESIAKAAQGAQTPPPQTGGSKAVVWTGTAMFVGGMTVGLFSFIKNENGSFSEFGEADATRRRLGAAGLSAAFAGGVLIFLGSHQMKHSPSVAVGAGQVTVSKRVSW
ncbi:MAG: hypothetical protein HY047_00465 [Acidobacteria bacterium]|nr:hypothetical protein [Acidobacteriota bacterium]